MAQRTLNTRLQLKYDSYTNWTTNNPVLLEGEVAIAAIESNAGGVKNAPSIIMKVGDGTNPYNDLKIVSGLAANVSEWATADAKPEYAASEIGGLEDYINATVKDTNTSYKIVAVDDYNYKLQSKEADGDWTDVANSTIVIPKYDDTQVKADIDALEALVGTTAVATQIANAIAALDLANTYEAKGAAATAQANAKTYTDELANGAVADNTAAIAAIKDGANIDSFKDVEDAIAATEAKVTENAEAIEAVEETIGEVTEGKTIVQMIADAQSNATFDDSEVKGLIQANTDAIDAIEADYLKAADKEELQGQITANTEAIGVLNGTGEGSVTKQVADAVAAAAHLKRTIVDSVEAIDVSAADADQYIYMVAKTGTNGDSYDEYMVIDGAVERVGDWVVDLSEYAKSADVKATTDALGNRLTTAEGEIDALQADSHTHDNKGVLDGISADDVTAWNGAVTGVAEINETIGEVPEDKTVVQMIADAQAAATYDDTQIKADVAANTESIEDVSDRVTTLETNAITEADTLVLQCGNSVIS